MVTGLGAAISDTGSPDNLIVMRRGATTETYSPMKLDQFDALKFLPRSATTRPAIRWLRRNCPCRPFWSAKASGG